MTFKSMQYLIICIFALILILYIHTIRQSREIKTLNSLIFSLSSVSNEYIFLYNTKKNRVKLVKQFVDILNNMEETKGQLDIDSDNMIDPSTSKLNKDILDIFTGKNTVDEITLHGLDGKAHVFRIYQNIQPDAYSDNLFTIGKFVDITEAKHFEKQSKCDSMTGLYNATTTKSIVTEKLSSMCQEHMSALFIIDIDFFKRINDTYGHLKGDETIMAASETFKSVFRSSDILGRVGGDEFCIFISGPFSQDIIIRKCQELKDIFNEKTEKIGVKATLSIGISIQKGSFDYEKIYENADKALYERKHSGRDGFTISMLEL